MDAVESWGYWLTEFNLQSAAQAPHDLLVVDELSSRAATDRDAAAEAVARLQQHPDGGRRIVLTYLSIGEAEQYRSYWMNDWRTARTKPEWLGAEDREWPGNYHVQYWHPAWQQLVFGKPDSALDRVIAQGFDGIYIDRADEFSLWESKRGSARADMADFLVRLAAYARERNPRFIVVMQNAEELLEHAPVIDAIDGIAKEELLYGVERAEVANKPEEVTWSLKYLRGAQRAGRKVLVVEYLKDPAKMLLAAERILDEGFVPYFAPRMLDCLNPPAVLDEFGHLPEHHCR